MTIKDLKEDLKFLLKYIKNLSIDIKNMESLLTKCDEDLFERVIVVGYHLNNETEELTKEQVQDKLNSFKKSRKEAKVLVDVIKFKTNNLLK